MKSEKPTRPSEESSGRPGQGNAPVESSPFRFVASNPRAVDGKQAQQEQNKPDSGPSKPSAVEAVQGANPVRKTVLPPRRGEVSVKEEMETRRQKAAEAAPLERRPRPAKNERKKLIEEAVRQEAAPEDAGITALPPKKKTIAPENTALVDPFETNEEVVRELGLGDVLASIQAQAPISKILENSLPTPKRTIVDSGGKTPEIHSTAAPMAPKQITPEPRPAADEKRAPKAAAKVNALPQRRKSHEELEQLTDLRSLDRVSSPKTLEKWVDSVRNVKETTALEESLEELARKPTEEPKLSKSRLRFHCPACYHSISMPKKIAGQKTRCPQCDSAIKAPDPKHRKTAHNYERHIEALLHPENFPMPASPRPKFMGMPVPTPHQSIVGTAAAMLVCGGIFSLNMKGKMTEQPHETANLVVQSGVSVDQQKEEAAKVVSLFLQANGWEQKAAYVRDAERVMPLMKDHYERLGGAEPAEVAKVVSSAPAFYASSDLKDPVATVTAELPDGEVRSFRVEFIDGKPVIEWEASVAYNARNWDQIVSDENAEPQMMRVAAALDKYWNYQFSDDREYLSVHLIDPVTKISLGNGYIARGTEDGARLRQFLDGTSKRRPEQITIMVRPVTKSREHRMVEIVQFVKGGFRTLDTLASNGNSKQPTQ